MKQTEQITGQTEAYEADRTDHRTDRRIIMKQTEQITGQTEGYEADRTDHRTDRRI